MRDLCAAKSIRWNIKNELRKLKKWSAGYDIGYHCRYFEEKLNDPNPHSAAYALKDVGLAMSLRGAAMVLEGDLSGWEEIHADWR